MNASCKDCHTDINGKRLTSILYIRSSYILFLYLNHKTSQHNSRVDIGQNSQNLIAMSEQQSESINMNIDKVAMMATDTKQSNANRKLSLTLPLLNVISTEMVNNHDVAMVRTQSDDQPSTANERRAATSKMKQIYESDDKFIQTIFSQTIKSTTATPTDDEFSPEFDGSHRASMQSNGSSDVVRVDASTNMNDSNVSEYALSSIDEPTAAFTYFHQTIEADEPPQDFNESITSYSPGHTAIARPHSNRTEMDASNSIDNDCGDDGNVADNNDCANNTSHTDISHNAEHEHTDISLTNTISPSDSIVDDSEESETNSLSSDTMNVSIL